MSRFCKLALQVFQEENSRLRAAKTGEGLYCLAQSSERPIPAAWQPSSPWCSAGGFKPARRALKGRQFFIEEVPTRRLCAFLHAAAEEGNNDAAIALALSTWRLLGFTVASEKWLRRVAEAGRGEGLLLGLQLLPRMRDCCDEMISWLEPGLGLQGQVVWEEVLAAKVALAKGYIHILRPTDDDACADILRGETLGKVDERLLAAFLIRLHRGQVSMPRTQATIELFLQSS